jgi:PTS system nitrogen regulatory IIA component
MNEAALARLLPPERIEPALKAVSKEEVLRALAKRLAPACASTADDVEAALAGREALGSTGVGCGVALPHARLDGLAEPVAVFARLERPIDFAAVDERPVSLVCAMLLPSNELKALAAMSRRLRQDGVLARLRAARDRDELQRALVSET